MMSINREQTLVENVVMVIAQFDYDKAKELADKEREKESNKTNPSPIWLNTLFSLEQLNQAEKAFTALSFLVPKSFLRKDTSIKNTYETLCLDLRRIEESGKTANADSIEKVLAHICGQLGYFGQARLQLTEFYEHVCSMGANRVINFEELLLHIREICEKHNKNFHHPSLSALKSSFTFECEVMMKLLEAQIAMQNMNFLSAILQLHEAHTKLCAWESMIQIKEARHSLSFSLKQPNPAHYHWLWKFKRALSSKFTFYFHNILSQQTTAQDMKSVTSRATVDFYSKLVSFQRKTDAKYALLIFDAAGCDQYKGQGYQHPDKLYQQPCGIDSFKAIVYYPTKPAQLWPSVVMTISDRVNELNTMERIVTVFDDSLQMTYFLTRIEPRLTLLIIYDSKKSEKDSNITNFMAAFSCELRSNKLLMSLKPGSKN